MKPSTLFIILAFVALAVLFFGIHKEANDLKKLQEEQVFYDSITEKAKPFCMPFV